MEIEEIEIDAAEGSRGGFGTTGYETETAGAKAVQQPPISFPN